MESTIYHVDVNSAFLSWTAMKELREHGGDDLRELRIHDALPIFLRFLVGCRARSGRARPYHKQRGRERHHQKRIVKPPASFYNQTGTAFRAGFSFTGESL